MDKILKLEYKVPALEQSSVRGEERERERERERE